MAPSALNDKEQQKKNQDVGVTANKGPIVIVSNRDRKGRARKFRKVRNTNDSSSFWLVEDTSSILAIESPSPGKYAFEPTQTKKIWAGWRAEES